MDLTGELGNTLDEHEKIPSNNLIGTHAIIY